MNALTSAIEIKYFNSYFNQYHAVESEYHSLARPPELRKGETPERREGDGTREEEWETDGGYLNDVGLLKLQKVHSQLMMI